MSHPPVATSWAGWARGVISHDDIIIVVPGTILLALWESNYYRSCPVPYSGQRPPEGPPQLRQVYLKYQDPPHRSTTFEIDDSALTENGFTCDAYPQKFTPNTLTLTSTDSLCIKIYSDSLSNHRFAVGLGQSFGKDWIHVVSDDSNMTPPPSFQDYTVHKYREMLVGMPEHAQHMNKASSGAERYGRICIMQTRLPRTSGLLQISSVMWKSSRMCRVKLQVFQDPGFGDVSGQWTAFDVDVSSFLHVSLALISLFI